MLTTQQLSDQAEITRVLQLYFDALDNKAFERLDGVFAADAIVDYQTGDMCTGPVPAGEMVELFPVFLQGFVFTQHMMSQPLIDVDGDIARSKTTLRAIHVLEKADGVRSTWLVYGTYRDVFARTSAGWRIRERVFRSAHTEGEFSVDG